MSKWNVIRTEEAKRFICTPYGEVAEHIWRPWSQCQHCPTITLFRG